MTQIRRKAAGALLGLMIAGTVWLGLTRPAGAVTQTYCTRTYAGYQCSTYTSPQPPVYYQPPTYIPPVRQTYCNYTYAGYNCTTY